MQYTQVLTSIGILIVSFLAGIVFLYTVSSKPRDEKKQEVNTLISFVINFVLFIWAGKVLVNLPLLFSDPLVVLARPSDSKAFYVAVSLLVLNVIYHKVRLKLNVRALFHAFLLFFISASFMYEFIKITFSGNTSTWEYLVLLLILLVGMTMLEAKIKQTTLIYIVGGTWLLGQLILGALFSQIVIFTYLISPLFIIILGIGLLVLIGYDYSHKSGMDKVEEME